MIVKFDFSDFERQAKRLGAMADQIPFALAGALNDAAETTRKELVTDTWPSHVQARNKSFMKAALTTKGERANKKKLSVAIYDRLDRANLKLHDDGGTRTANKGALAIPSQIVKPRRSAKGVPDSLRPAGLPRAFRQGDVIYQRPVYKKHPLPKTAAGRTKRKLQRISNPGKFKQAPLKLMYTLKPSVPIKADVPFDTDFEKSMRREVSKAFSPRLAAAMKTRRPKR